MPFSGGKTRFFSGLNNQKNKTKKETKQQKQQQQIRRV